MRRWPVVLCLVAGSLPVSQARAQCAMCGAAAGSSPGVARGMAISIFFLLGTLSAVVAWLVALVMRRGTGRRGLGALPAAGTAIQPATLPGGHAPADR